MSLLSAFEDKARKIWGTLSGEVKADLEKALAEARAEEEKILPLVTAFSEQLGRQVLADLAPEAKALGESLLAELLAGLGGVLGKAPEPPAAG